MIGTSMSFATCSVCKGRVTINPNERKYLDRSGDFVCSSTCLFGWARKNKPKKIKPPMSYSGVMQAEMGGTFEVYSSLLRMGFRSGYELSVAEWLYNNEIVFEYEPYTFLLHTDTASYTPDFYLPEYHCLLEIKGIWMRRNKIQQFRNIYNIPIIVATWPIRKSFEYKRTGGRYGGSF